MNEIHSTAIIHPRSRIGSNNFIGPYCIIGPGVSMGNNNRLEAFVSIGTPPEHKDHFTSEGFGVVIGSNNVLRESVTVNSGTDRPTIVSDHCILLRGSHVGHDAVIRGNVTLSCSVLIGGHSIVGSHANLGLGVVVRQRLVIGGLAMIGMGSVVTKHLMPMSKSYGSPAKTKGLNKIGINRFFKEEIDFSLLEAEMMFAVRKNARLVGFADPNIEHFFFDFKYDLARTES